MEFPDFECKTRFDCNHIGDSTLCLAFSGERDTDCSRIYMHIGFEWDSINCKIHAMFKWERFKCGVHMVKGWRWKIIDVTLEMCFERWRYCRCSAENIDVELAYDDQMTIGSCKVIVPGIESVTFRKLHRLIWRMSGTWDTPVQLECKQFSGNPDQIQVLGFHLNDKGRFANANIYSKMKSMGNNQIFFQLCMARIWRKDRQFFFIPRAETNGPY